MRRIACGFWRGYCAKIHKKSFTPKRPPHNTQKQNPRAEEPAGDTTPAYKGKATETANKPGLTEAGHRKTSEL